MIPETQALCFLYATTLNYYSKVREKQIYTLPI